jgi:hypothetical protein
MTDKFYKLSQSFDRFDEDDEPEDGYLEQFDGCNDIETAFFDCATITLSGDKGVVEPEIIIEEGVWGVLKAQMPEKLKFTGVRKWLSLTDFPSIQYARSWPIMSMRMVNVLLSVGDFSHQIIPVTFRNHSGIAIDYDYAILNLVGLARFMDLDQSVYTTKPSRTDPTKSMVWDIEKLVLKKPEGGFPPMFRVQWNTVDLCVSAEARDALEAADIKGLRFSTIR